MLHILALETSDLHGSVAVAAGDNVLAELHLDAAQRSARSLAPAIRSILEKIRWKPKQIDLVAVTIGPGSFTGLRIGVATAKVFAYAVGAEVLGISTLEAIAAGAPPEIKRLSVAIDAQRGDVVAQPFYRGEYDLLKPTSESDLLAMNAWIAGLEPGSAIAGPVLKKWPGEFPPSVTVLGQQFWHPTASSVARLAFRDFSAGRRDDVWKLLPLYSRPSAAEEKNKLAE